MQSFTFGKQQSEAEAVESCVELQADIHFKSIFANMTLLRKIELATEARITWNHHNYKLICAAFQNITPISKERNLRRVDNTRDMWLERHKFKHVPVTDLFEP